ncbi:MAG: hypothetical protein WCS37_03710 [Chloroflexota bacterium]
MELEENSQEENNPEPTPEDKPHDRPDPMFKAVTSEFVKESGIETIETEFPQTLRADMVLKVPEGLMLEETLFSFFRRFNIVEFKGENNQLNIDGFLRNEARMILFYLYNKEATFENMLNLIVSSRFPQSFFDYMEARQCKFEPEKDRPWLWRSRVGLQEVVVIVCRDLPLESRYYQWLLFAPSDSRKWKAFVRMLAREGNLTLLERLRKLRPQEYENMSLEIKELLKEYTPEERKRYMKALAHGVAFEMPDIAREAPEELSEAIAKLSPEELDQTLAKLTPKQLLARVAPEERLAGISPEERLAGVAPEERLAGVTPEELSQTLSKLSPEQRLAGMTKEERLAGMTKEELLAGMTKEELLAGMTKEERQQLLELLAKEDKQAE